MNRRDFLGGALALPALHGAPTTTMRILDTHIHLFDPTRPQGIPWPPKDNALLYKPALPNRYRKIAEPLGVVGAIEVECSPWLDDNQWVLDIAARDPIMVGMIGNLEPEKPDFRRHLNRLRRNPLYLGIRCGNLWDRDLPAQVGNPRFLEGVKALADAGLTMDTANQNEALLDAVVRLTDRIANLRVVIDHLPQFWPPSEPVARKAYDETLRELAKRPSVYCKLSEVLRRVDGQVRTDLAFYRARLDGLFETFGEDRLVYGSDWPNSDQWAEYPQVLAIVKEYFSGKGEAAARKYFFDNSRAAYRWKGLK